MGERALSSNMRLFYEYHAIDGNAFGYESECGVVFFDQGSGFFYPCSLRLSPFNMELTFTGQDGEPFSRRESMSSVFLPVIFERCGEGCLKIWGDYLVFESVADCGRAIEYLRKCNLQADEAVVAGLRESFDIAARLYGSGYDKVMGNFIGMVPELAYLDPNAASASLLWLCFANPITGRYALGSYAGLTDEEKGVCWEFIRASEGRRLCVLFNHLLTELKSVLFSFEGVEALLAHSVAYFLYRRHLASLHEQGLIELPRAFRFNDIDDYLAECEVSDCLLMDEFFYLGGECDPFGEYDDLRALDLYRDQVRGTGLLVPEEEFRERLFADVPVKPVKKTLQELTGLTDADFEAMESWLDQASFDPESGEWF